MGYNHQWAVELFQEFLTRYQKELTAPMICAAEFAIDTDKRSIQLLLRIKPQLRKSYPILSVLNFNSL